MAKPVEAITEARWPAIIAIVGLTGCSLALPPELVLGPRWAIPVLVGILVGATALAHRAGAHRLDRAGGYAISTIVTLALIYSIVRLLMTLPSKTEPATLLLKSAAVLWVTNLLVFGLWYWRLDGGGPHAREKRGEHTEGAFFFPQMMPGGDVGGAERWMPNFVDYLFVAFATSTTLGPTDTAIMSRWAKVLTMVQSLIAMICVGVLLSRALGAL